MPDIHSKPPDFSHIDRLVGGWFHQDFDLAGSTLGDIVGHYERASSKRELEGLSREIREFLAASRGREDDEFVKRFSPGVLPAQWSMNTAQFLECVLQLLTAQRPSHDTPFD